jgi:hypothetical protein
MGGSDRMRRHETAAFSLLAGILATLCVRPARADAGECASRAVEADAGVTTRWPDLSSQIKDAFEAREDVDPCARVKLVLAGAVIIVEVGLPDGRSAVRAVPGPDDVLPALEALLLLPQPGPRTPPEESPVDAPAPTRLATAAPVIRAEGGVSRSASEAHPGPPTTDVGHVRVDLSVATGARVSTGEVGVDLGVLSSVELGGWLLGFQGHLNRYYATSSRTPQMPSDGPAALELGVLAGRRLRFGRISLDLFAGPALALHGTSASAAQAAPTGTTVTETSSTEPIPRLLASSRLTFGRSALRTFVEIDGEMGETGPTSSSVPLGPQLPTWTVGVALGAVVGTR